MLEDTRGRTVKTMGEAKDFIWSFIRENAQGDHRIQEHSHDFDLYLPWLLEIIENLKVPDREGLLSVNDLQRLYMDAAWDLVMDGYLRPGAKVITGDDRGGYGKGYSVTQKGAVQLKELDGDGPERLA